MPNKNYKEAVGGLWEEMGELGIDFLKSEGLKPEHKFLDIGCGPGRIGVPVSEYLEPGNYYGVEKEQWLLDNFERGDREPNLLCDENFNFAHFGTEFDVAFAQSVFTHMDNDKIRSLLENLRPVLKGSLYATFFDPVNGNHTIKTHDNSDPFHQTVDTLRSLAAGYDVEEIGDWGHPRGQRMIKISVDASHLDSEEEVAEEAAPETVAVTDKKDVVVEPEPLDVWSYESPSVNDDEEEEAPSADSDIPSAEELEEMSRKEVIDLAKSLGIEEEPRKYTKSYIEDIEALRN